jgi:hypothetical protein
MLGIDYNINVMYNEEYMENNMYVVAMPYPNHVDLPDILEKENGKVMYFKNKQDAEMFIQELYDEKGIPLKAFKDDTIELLRVQ